MNKSTLKREIVKCGTDPEYFIRNYVKIQHPKRGLIPFDLFDYQVDLLSGYENQRFNIVLKARQLGITELSAAYAAWLMLFRRDKNVVVLATKKDTAKELIRRIHTTLDNLPPWLMLTRIKRDNVFSIEFSNGSRIKAMSTAKDAGRSEAASLLIVDEAAHIENMDSIWTGLRPVVVAGGAVIILSTPNGVGNMFHRTWVSAESGDGEFYPTKLMWWVHPEHIDGLCDDPMRPGFKTSPWFEKETVDLSAREIAQEHECNFNASGDTYISAEFIQWMSDNTVIVPTSCEYYDRSLFVWKEPQEGKTYLLCADVARGDGKDNSAFHVFDAEKMEQVVEYCGKIPTDAFGDLITYTGNKYNNALVVVENNTVGLACLETIKGNEYENIYFSSKGDFRPGKCFSAMLPLPSITEYVPGFTTSQKSRPLILHKLEEFIRHRDVTFRSKRFTDELRKFIWNGGRPEAQKGYNDDLVLAAAIACWIRDTFLASGFVTAEISKTLLGLTMLEKTDQTQIPGATKDPRFIRANESLLPVRNNPLQMTMPDGTIENLGWLISSK